MTRKGHESWAAKVIPVGSASGHPSPAARAGVGVTAGADVAVGDGGTDVGDGGTGVAVGATGLVVGEGGTDVAVGATGLVVAVGRGAGVAAATSAVDWVVVPPPGVAVSAATTPPSVAVASADPTSVPVLETSTTAPRLSTKRIKITIPIAVAIKTVRDSLAGCITITCLDCSGDSA
jgi:hypothetical protein